MRRLNTYIVEKLSFKKGMMEYNSLPENGEILINLLKLTDNKLIDAISNWMKKNDVKDISVHVNLKYVYNFKKITELKWDGKINEEIFKGKSFLCTSDDGNFNIMKWIINGSHDYSKLINILLYKSEKDNLNLYGSEHGLYVQHKDYELIILKINEKNK